MEVIATSLIAVLGTLLGSAATFLIQRSTIAQQERLNHAERLRQDRVDAFTIFGGALVNYRKTRMDRWHSARGDNNLDLGEARQASWVLRTTALEA